MAKLRKALVAGVGMITILSMSMLMVPLQVGAAAQAGDLIKMNGLSSVYYLAGDGKRYVFPNESTYFSWYSDFSKVVTIPQAELESYPLGKNVTVRPGTKLVKITTNPKVYAVTPGGVLTAVPDEATAKTLWGDNWAKRVIDVPDAFFTNYTTSSSNVSAAAYPAGSLVKYSGAADVFYIAADGKAQKIATEAAFNANGFKWSDIVNATIAKPAAGADIAAKDTTISDTASGAGGMIYTGGTGLTVSLSGDTPASRNVPSLSTLVPFVTVNLTASNDGAITVDQLVFTRKGTGATADFDGGYLYNGNTILSTKRSVNSNDNTITFTALNLTIPAGATQAVTLKMNARTDDSSGIGLSTGNHYFQLASASAVAATGVTVSGSFPVSGNIMSYSTVEAGTVTVANAGSNTSYKVGETGRTISEFTIQDNSKEDVNITRIRLKNNGTAGDASIANVSLDLDGTIVKSGVTMTNKYIDFILDTSFLLKKSNTITATIRGDIIGDIGKKLALYIKDNTDLEARGTAYGDFYGATIVNGLTAAIVWGTNGTGTDGNGTITVNGSEINVSSDGPDATDYKDNTQNVVLANVHLSTVNQDVLFDTLAFGLTSSGTSSVSWLDNIELVDSANNASYSTDDENASSDTLSFDNVYLKKGVQYNFQLRGDIPDGAYAGVTYYVTLNTGSGQTAHFQDADQTAVASGDYSSSGFTGKTMTIAAPTIIFSKVTTSNATVVQSAAGVLLYKGKITANNVDNLKVSRVKIDSYAGHAGAGLLSADFQRLYFYQVNADGSETKLDDETSLTTASGITFTGFTLNIPKGVSNGIYVTVRGDVKANPTGTTTKLYFDGTYTNYTVKDSDNNAVVGNSIDTGYGQITTVGTSGTYVLDIDTTEAGVNANQNVLAGNIIKAGRIKVTAQNEIAILKDLVIMNTGTADNDTAATAYLYKDKGMTQEVGHADFGLVSGNYYALLQGLNSGAGVEIPATGITYLYVGVLVKPIDYSSSKGADSTGAANYTIKVEVPADITAAGLITKVTGKSTGTTLSNSSLPSDESYASNVMGAVMANITTDFAPAANSLSTGLQDIFSFKVTAPTNLPTTPDNVAYDGSPLGIKLATTTFTVATTSGITLDTFKIYRVGGTEQSAKGVTTGTDAAISGHTFTVNFGNTYGATDQDLIIKPGETATYIVRANVGGLGANNNSVRTTIETVDSSVSYTHTTTSSTVNATPVNPLLTGISSVRGGSLSIN